LATTVIDLRFTTS